MESKAERDQVLQGMRILVVDDELLIVLGVEEALRDAGAQVESAATLPMALSCVATGAHSAALLDVRLGRQTTETVADALAARGVPFVFYTGQALPEAIRVKHPEVLVLAKPSRLDAFVEAMARVKRD